MNNLSWFLYAIDVLSNIKGLLIFLTLFGVFVGVFYALFCLIQLEQFPKWWVIVCLLLPAVPLTLIPDKNTMYAIGASELGEHVVNSEIGQKAKKAIEVWIDSQLKVPTK